MLFFQKLDRQRSTDVETPDWVDVDIIHENDHVNTAGETRHRTVSLNQYYQQHPEMVLGDLEIISGPFGPQLVCKPTPGEDLSEQLAHAIQFLQAEIKPYEQEELDEEEDRSIPANPNVKTSATRWQTAGVLPGKQPHAPGGSLRHRRKPDPGHDRAAGMCPQAH